MLAPATLDAADGCRAAFPGVPRGGLGAAAFAHAARAAADAGLVARHRALVSNPRSIAIARRPGFVPCAASLAVRLRADLLDG